MTLLLSMLLSAAAMDPHVLGVERVDLGNPISGSDYLLIAEAARRAELRGVNLTCYEIFVYRDHGLHRVAFVDRRDREIEQKTAEGTQITWLPPDPKCRSISFEMDRAGHVRRVIPSLD